MFLKSFRVSVRHLKFNFSSLVVISSPLIALNTLALPDPASSLPAEVIKEFSKKPQLEGSVVLRDHEKSDVYYVGPSTKKIQAGSFKYVDYATNCDSLKDVFRLSFAVPGVSEDRFSETAKRGSYSPFFDSHFGNPIIYSDILRKLMSSIGNEEKLKEEKADLFSAFEAAKKDFELAVQEVTQSNAAIKEVVSNVQNAANMVAASSNPEERQAAERLLEDVKSQRDILMPQLKERWANAIKNEALVRPKYVEAHGKVAPYLVSLSDINDRINSLKNIYADLDMVSFSAFQRLESTLSKFRARPVGVATAAYSIWSDELTAAAEALTELKMGHVKVVALPIVNITLDTGKIETRTLTADGSGTNLAGDEFVKASRSGDGLVKIDGNQEKTTQPVFKDESGQAVRPLVSKYSNQSSAVIEFPITQGAYCMGSSEGVSKKYLTKDLDNKTVSFDGLKYTERTTNKLNQSVALNYQYFVKAEPISVNCSLNISQINNYIRNKGSSGILFWRKSWDETERNLLKENGLSCDVKDSPNMLDENEKIRWKNDMITRMSQEILAEYTVQFAQKWDVIEKQPIDLPQSSYSAMGNMSLLCGGIFYCQIANIVWKTADALFGSQTGSSTARDVLQGSISRNYSEWGYRMVPASSRIELSVEVK
jgi:hypothetical protein